MEKRARAHARIAKILKRPDEISTICFPPDDYRMLLQWRNSNEHFSAPVGNILC